MKDSYWYDRRIVYVKLALMALGLLAGLSYYWALC